MKRITFIILTVIATVKQIPGQEKPSAYPHNFAYIEVAGNSQTLMSVNYERAIFSGRDSTIFFGLRLGIALPQNKYDKTIMFDFPVEAIALYGKRKHFLELAAGCAPIIGTSNLSDTLIPPQAKTNINYIFSLRAGYRFISKSGVVFRFAPLLLFLSDLPHSSKYSCIGSVGISIGYSW